MLQVYFTLLATVPTMTAPRRKSIQRAVTQIVQLHEELLAALHRVVPNSELKEDGTLHHSRRKRSHHTRWRSAENAPLRPVRSALERRLRHSIDAGRPMQLLQSGFMINTNTVLNVAKVFDKFVGARILLHHRTR
jgi:hypothetical protein